MKGITFFWALVAVFSLVVCSKDCPECKECLECPEGQHVECVPDEPPPPPPPPGPEPSDYIDKDRAGELGERCARSTGILAELCFGEQRISNNGVRNPEYALTHCRDELPGPWPVTGPEDLEDILEENRATLAELLRFMANLQKTNKRCDAQPEFCNKTDVKKSRFKDFSENRWPVAEAWSADLDGMRGWCESIRRNR